MIAAPARSTQAQTDDEWRGEYYSNRYLAGNPTLVREDESIDFNWGAGAPAGGLPSDTFSVRWTRSLHFAPGRYEFRTVTDDGVRLYVDGQLIIDEWRPGVGTIEREVRLDEGIHALRMEYFEATGAATARLSWRGPLVRSGVGNVITCVPPYPDNYAWINVVLTRTFLFQETHMFGGVARMSHARVLVVDDEEDLRAELKSLLERTGFEVELAADGEEALHRAAAGGLDLIVLDVVMPHIDGREVLRRLRNRDDWTPVILLTKVGTSGERVELTPRAYRVLEHLMLHAGEIISRQRLLDEVWGWAYAVGTRAVDVRIAELRKALDDDPEAPHYVETVIGQGYRFIGEVEGRT